MKAPRRRCRSLALSEWSKRMPRMIAFRPCHSEPRDARDVRLGRTARLAAPRGAGCAIACRRAACPASTSRASRRSRSFPGGHSNLTYLLRFGDVDIVVRRPPFGPLPPTAHDMAREFRWLSAMHRVFPLAPQAVPALRRSSMSSGRCSMRWSGGAAWSCAPTNRRRWRINPPRGDASAKR